MAKGKLSATTLTGQSNPVAALVGATVGSQLAARVAGGNPLIALGLTGAAATMGSGAIKGAGQGATMVLVATLLAPAIQQFTSGLGVTAGSSASGATDSFGTVVA